jgi:hypothetical protein
MRVLKSGEIKYKASAYKEAERLSNKPLPMPIYRAGTKVKVYMAAQWATGIVRVSTHEMCTVHITKGDRLVNCRDARNLVVA